MPTKDHAVRNGVLGTVIGGIVLAGLAEVWPPFKKALVWLWDSTVTFFGFVTNSYSVQGWALALLVLLALPTLVRTVIGLRKAPTPAYLQYIQDSFYGATWRWSWASSGISHLWAFCPRCDSELVYDDSSCRSLYSENRRTDFLCEHCGHSKVASVPGGDKDYAVAVIEREIRRKLRTNELPTANQES